MYLKRKLLLLRLISSERRKYTTTKEEEQEEPKSNYVKNHLQSRRERLTVAKQTKTKNLLCTHLPSLLVIIYYFSKLIAVYHIIIATASCPCCLEYLSFPTIWRVLKRKWIKKGCDWSCHCPPQEGLHLVKKNKKQWLQLILLAKKYRDVRFVFSLFIIRRCGPHLRSVLFRCHISTTP